MPDNSQVTKSKLFNINMNKRAFGILVAILVVLIIMGLIGFYAPTVFFAILNFFWISLIAITVIFLFLGTLVIIGMKSEVSRILDFLLEGSLTVIDFIDFLREVIHNFIETVKEFILFAVPVFSVLAAFLVYMLLLYVYKTVGSQNDVTWFTVVITFTLIFLVGVLNRPVLQDENEVKSWIKQVGERFKFVFNDSLEVVIFIFFLTLDSTNLFFLPDKLNVPLHAMLGDYDLMKRGFTLNNHLRTTVILIVLAIVIEIVRNVLRVVVGAFIYYRQGQMQRVTQGLNIRGLDIFKESIRKSFFDLKNDLLRFITFTTFLIFVFLLFPRLKLLAVAVTSLTFLLLDFVFPERFSVHKKSTDLVSRILGTVFKI
ncbi:MAG TPA: hypothetical protein VLI92_04325 [Candidatus Saccharimonadales bacterium]|nr:hypothetical protein [Candidatus Saccharimonadales bacterium]